MLTLTLARQAPGGGVDGRGQLPGAIHLARCTFGVFDLHLRTFDGDLELLARQAWHVELQRGGLFILRHGVARSAAGRGCRHCVQQKTLQCHIGRAGSAGCATGHHGREKHQG